MKQTINNLVYNTETATFVAEASNYGGNDFHAWREKLYLSKKGNWFLHGMGGAMSKYAEHYCNSSTNGERIIPMTRDEALAWCAEHERQKAIDEYFADMVDEA